MTPPLDHANAHVVRRVAVRAVVVRDGRLLLLQAHGGDVKMPGGGVEKGEGHQEALMREVQEETGYEVLRIGDRLTTVVETHPDVLDPARLFEMTSHYYDVEVSDGRGATHLSASEQEAGLVPVWLTVADALDANRSAMASGSAMACAQRETQVLTGLTLGG